MKYQDIVIVKRWILILKEYERTKAKIPARAFKFVKNLCEAQHISKKELSRYYRKRIDGGRKEETNKAAPANPNPYSYKRLVDNYKKSNYNKVVKPFGIPRLPCIGACFLIIRLDDFIVMVA